MIGCPHQHLVHTRPQTKAAEQAYCPILSPSSAIWILVLIPHRPSTQPFSSFLNQGLSPSLPRSPKTNHISSTTLSNQVPIYGLLQQTLKNGSYLGILARLALNIEQACHTYTCMYSTLRACRPWSSTVPRRFQHQTVGRETASSRDLCTLIVLSVGLKVVVLYGGGRGSREGKGARGVRYCVSK
jgi:hypothetical protein